MIKKSKLQHRFFSIVLLSLLFVSFSHAQPTTSILDTFDGTQQPLTTNWTGGITASGNCDKVSGVAINRNADGDEACYYDVSSFGANQEMFMTFPNAANHTNDSNIRVYMCLHDSIGTATVDGYGLRYRKVTGTGPNDVIQLFKMGNGSAGYTNIGSSYTAVEFANNHKVAMIIDSANYPTSLDFEVFLDTGSGWTSIITHTESTTVYNCASTHIGIEIPSTTHQVDDFGGGTTVVAGGGNNLLMIPPMYFD